eukprot:2663075-Rhodomonas_salina.1
MVWGHLDSRGHLGVPLVQHKEGGDSSTERNETKRLRTMVRYLEVQAERAEGMIQDERRRQSRASVASDGSAGQRFLTHRKTAGARLEA